MDYNAVDPNTWQAKLVIGVAKRLRSARNFSQENVKKNAEKSSKLRRKRAGQYGHTTSMAATQGRAVETDELGERDYSIFSEATTLAEANKDHTDMLHGLTHSDSLEDLMNGAGIKGLLEGETPGVAEEVTPLMELHHRQFNALPSEVWHQIASHLSPADAASLAMSSKILYRKIGAETLNKLNDPEHIWHKSSFLQQRDHRLPRHLFCFPCGQYHRRTSTTDEVYKADFVNNPLFNCPMVKASVLPRMRLTHGRELPYSFVQLTARAHKHSPRHGIHPDSLSRRWKCRDSSWNHRTRFIIHDGRLLMRVVSSVHAPPAAEMTETSKRHLLYDREEFTPYFSVCAHWKDGELMRICKCALSHIPRPPVSYAQQLKKAPKLSRELTRPQFIVRGCDECRPARRCPECPTEYLVEVQMTEDKNDPVRQFKHAIVVTRWSDLGDGTSPYTSPEWAAMKGLPSDEVYNSFSHVGRRAVAGIFESKVSGTIPGQRMISLNPKNDKLGDSGKTEIYKRSVVAQTDS